MGVTQAGKDLVLDAWEDNFADLEIVEEGDGDTVRKTAILERHDDRVVSRVLFDAGEANWRSTKVRLYGVSSELLGTEEIDVEKTDNQSLTVVRTDRLEVGPA